MNTKFIVLAFIFAISGMAPTHAWAFYCSGGLPQVAPPALKKDTNSNVAIINMASSVTCNGNTLDNLRIYNSYLDSRLASYGFTGVLNIGGARYDMPANGQYIWPYANSSAATTGTFPVNVTLELKRSSTGAWGTGVTLPAGTTLATIIAEQRSGSQWGWHQTWNVVLSAPLVIPAYTCNVTNGENRVIKLPHADKSEVRGIGKGIFTSSKTRFSLNLDCDVMATVDLSFSGPTMVGNDDVLANQESGNDNIGVQIFPAGSSTAITFDNVANRVIDSASAKETFDYDAYYYYKGGPLQAGPIRTSAIYTFTYK